MFRTPQAHVYDGVMAEAHGIPIVVCQVQETSVSTFVTAPSTRIILSHLSYLRARLPAMYRHSFSTALEYQRMLL